MGALEHTYLRTDAKNLMLLLKAVFPYAQVQRKHTEDHHIIVTAFVGPHRVQFESPSGNKAHWVGSWFPDDGIAESVRAVSDFTKIGGWLSWIRHKMGQGAIKALKRAVDPTRFLSDQIEAIQAATVLYRIGTSGSDVVDRITPTINWGHPNSTVLTHCRVENSEVHVGGLAIFRKTKKMGQSFKDKLVMFAVLPIEKLGGAFSHASDLTMVFIVHHADLARAERQLERVYAERILKFLTDHVTAA